MDQAAHATTSLLRDLARGDRGAVDRLMPVVYEELRALAARYVGQQGGGQTLQPTALVHEAYMRLVAGPDGPFNGRAHFMALAAKVMRGILVDHARERAALKRGGDLHRVTLDEEVAVSASREVDVLALDEVLTRLTSLDERKARVVELRFFAGMSIEQTAEALGIARSTVAEDWRTARAWVAMELVGGAP
jgi:RNA polymerase sigma factor (TIGR02999 family)